ncbi:MAG: hypothetical protein J6Y20_15595 [Lachnospiraceae bacterium]|nr:hypothetical protein [Lachnospiraceae bacterium]
MKRRHPYFHPASDSAVGTPFEASSPAPRIPCRKCLIEGLKESEVMATLQEYINAIEPSRRTPDDIYRNRLSICEKCRHLSGGMCRLCGCFVLYRAATAGNGCPDTPQQW